MIQLCSTILVLFLEFHPSRPGWNRLPGSYEGALTRVWFLANLLPVPVSIVTVHDVTCIHGYVICQKNIIAFKLWRLWLNQIPKLLGQPDTDWLMDWNLLTFLVFVTRPQCGDKAQRDIRVNKKSRIKLGTVRLERWLLTNLYHQHLSPPSVFSFDLQYFELCVINNTLTHKCICKLWCSGTQPASKGVK